MNILNDKEVLFSCKTKFKTKDAWQAYPGLIVPLGWCGMFFAASIMAGHPVFGEFLLVFALPVFLISLDYTLWRLKGREVLEFSNGKLVVRQKRMFPRRYSIACEKVYSVDKYNYMDVKWQEFVSSEKISYSSSRAGRILIRYFSGKELKTYFLGSGLSDQDVEAIVDKLKSLMPQTKNQERRLKIFDSNMKFSDAQIFLINDLTVSSLVFVSAILLQQAIAIFTFPNFPFPVFVAFHMIFVLVIIFTIKLGPKYCTRHYVKNIAILELNYSFLHVKVKYAGLEYLFSYSVYSNQFAIREQGNTAELLVYDSSGHERSFNILDYEQHKSEVSQLVSTISKFCSLP